jgi:hypothetical protein
MATDPPVTLSFCRKRAYIAGWPAVPVMINDKASVLAIVDTGSQDSLLVYRYSNVAGIRQIEDPSKIVYIDGMRDEKAPLAKGYRHNVSIEIDGTKIKECPIVFVENHPFVRAGLEMILGRRVVFEALGCIAFEEGADPKYTHLK